MEEQRKGKEEKREDPDEIASFRSTFHRTGGGKEQRRKGEWNRQNAKVLPCEISFCISLGQKSKCKKSNSQRVASGLSRRKEKD
jgi:hypothetical protein